MTMDVGTYVCFAVVVASSISGIGKADCPDTWISFFGSCYHCPDTWVPFFGSCYLFGQKIAMNFSDAELFCRQRNARLVHVDRAAEQEFLKDTIVRSYSGEDFWIGLTDEKVDGRWIWHDTNNRATYTNWHPGEPNGIAGEDCAEISHGQNFMWNDILCDKLNEPICELPHGMVLIG